MKLSGHDIRMKEFRRAVLRGYSEADVGTFLMHLAIEIDQRDRLHHLNGEAHTTEPVVPEPTQTPATENPPGPRESAAQPLDPTATPGEPLGSEAQRARADTSMAAIGATDIVQQARVAAQEIHAEATAQAAAISAAARDSGQDVVGQARAKAERGLNKARQRAEEMLEYAREHPDRASRADAEAHLRLAHVEQQLAERQLALAEEAKRLDALARWMAQQDLQPDAEVHQPAHAAPVHSDVVELRTAAE